MSHLRNVALRTVLVGGGGVQCCPEDIVSGGGVQYCPEDIVSGG